MPIYEINLENFSGPISKLLSLIEDKKYEIRSVDLAKVTGDFVDFVNSLSNAHPRLLADFISVAARLMLIKSRDLVPDIELTPEEEEQITDLEERLKIYQQFKGATILFGELYGKRQTLFSRPERKRKKADDKVVFLPPQNLTAEILLLNLKKSINIIEELEKRYEKYDALNLEEYIANLWDRVSGRITKFSDVASGKDKREVIIFFIAVLNLLRENKISIQQDSHFSDITIRSN